MVPVIDASADESCFRFVAESQTTSPLEIAPLNIVFALGALGKAAR